MYPENYTGAEEGVAFMQSFSEGSKDDAWYGAISDALRILGKRWDSDVTDEEDAFILAYADEVAERPEHERDTDLP